MKYSSDYVVHNRLLPPNFLFGWWSAARRDVAAVEEFVEVGAEEEAVVDRVRFDVGEVADVGGLEDRQGALAGDGAAALVGVEDGNAEAVLPWRGRTRRGSP